MQFQAASVISLLALAGCATTTAENPDPYEGFNRQMFAFNEGVDKGLLQPVARGYRAVTNEPVRQGVTNFLRNLDEPITFANEVLQGKIGNAAGTVGRFVVNTTIGIAGIFNPAELMGIKRTDEDFGQTLAVWGVPSGPYLVLPFLGSSNPRDLSGRGVDLVMNPMYYLEFDGDSTLRTVQVVGDTVSWRENNLDMIDDVRTTQLDPYTT